LVADGLNRAIEEAKQDNRIQGVKLGRMERIPHLISMDDVLIFCFSVESEGRALKDILEFFCDAINKNKFSIYFSTVEEGIKQNISGIFNFSSFDLNEGFKYLGFFLKPDNYSVSY
jgi:hypothetical protein